MSTTFTPLDGKEFGKLFRDFKYSAYRLETLQQYSVPNEMEAFARFKSGQPRGVFPGASEWLENTVKPAIQAGKHMHRVHVVEEPLSDYVRFECLWGYSYSDGIGEEIKILPVNLGEWPDELPRLDYWLFDSSLMVRMNYDSDGAFESADLATDPAMIVKANLWRDAAVNRSISFSAFAVSLT